MEYFISVTGYDEKNNIIDESIRGVTVYDYDSAVREFEEMKSYAAAFAGYDDTFKCNITYYVGVYVEDEWGYLEIYNNLEAEFC